MLSLNIPAPYQDSAEFGRLILRDGSKATIRISTIPDADALVDFFHRLSPESRRRRFFSASEPTPEFVRGLSDSSNGMIDVSRRSGFPVEEKVKDGYVDIDFCVQPTESSVRFRITPLTTMDAFEMVREIRGYRLLEGYRGHPPADVEAIQEVLLRISRMVEEFPEISELDLNPVFALPPGEG